MQDRHMTEHKTFGRPDETREFPNGRVEILKVGGGQVGRLVLKPGWRWSNDVKPLANSESGWMTARNLLPAPATLRHCPADMTRGLSAMSRW